MRARRRRGWSRSSAGQPPRRGQQRMRASWVSSTWSRSTVSRRARVARSRTSTVSAVSLSSRRATRRLVSSVPSPKATTRVRNRRVRCCCVSLRPAQKASAVWARPPSRPPAAWNPARVGALPRRRCQVFSSACDSRGSARSRTVRRGRRGSGCRGSARRAAARQTTESAALLAGGLALAGMPSSHAAPLPHRPRRSSERQPCSSWSTTTASTSAAAPAAPSTRSSGRSTRGAVQRARPGGQPGAR